MKHILFFLAGLLIFFGDAFSQHDIRDAKGRVLILHGLNTSSGAKHDSLHQPWISEADVQRENEEFGFNAVRYLIFWGAIEPEEGQYDEAYLDRVKERVKWYTSRGMYVILDMHQDVFGYGVGGNGAPEWACANSVIRNLVPDRWPWWMQNAEPKVIRSYVHFFRKRGDELRNHYRDAWLKVIEMFKDDPYVIGYDLMNEPHGGRILKTLCGGFEKRWLKRFYTELITAIRKVDAQRYCFIEPRSFGVNFGMRSHLPAIDDPAKRLVYAPHCYMKFVDVGGDYEAKDKRALERWFRRRAREMKNQDAALLLGEFGLSPAKKDFNVYMQDILMRLDSLHASWTWWSNDRGGWSPLDPEGKVTPILSELLRVYPSAVDGRLQDFKYDAANRVFTMEFYPANRTNTETEIVIPKALYPEGFVLDADCPYAWKQDTEGSRCRFRTQGGGNLVRIKVEPLRW